MTFAEMVEIAGRITEGIGVAILLLGVVVMLVRYAAAAVASRAGGAYHATRSGLGRVLLLGLEVLVAGDIINTVAVEPTPVGIAVLAGIVAIRTFLSWAIQLETEGRWPWQRDRVAPAEAPAGQ